MCVSHTHTHTRKRTHTRNNDNTCTCSAVVSASEIDRLNVLRAALKAMVQAAEKLPRGSFDFVLVDGNRVPDGLRAPAEAIVKGDQRCSCIAAASIIAKVGGRRVRACVRVRLRMLARARQRPLGHSKCNRPHWGARKARTQRKHAGMLSHARPRAPAGAQGPDHGGAQHEAPVPALRLCAPQGARARIGGSRRVHAATRLLFTPSSPALPRLRGTACPPTSMRCGGTAPAPSTAAVSSPSGARAASQQLTRLSCPRLPARGAHAKRWNSRCARRTSCWAGQAVMHARARSKRARTRTHMRACTHARAQGHDRLVQGSPAGGGRCLTLCASRRRGGRRN